MFVNLIVLIFRKPWPVKWRFHSLTHPVLFKIPGIAFTYPILVTRSTNVEPIRYINRQKINLQQIATTTRLKWRLALMAATCKGVSPFLFLFMTEAVRFLDFFSPFLFALPLTVLSFFA